MLMAAPMRFGQGELNDLALAWVGVSLAFTIASAGIGLKTGWFVVLGVSAIAAGLGVVAHELAHKIVASRMGFQTRFVADRMMLLGGVVIALLGFVFLAPGGVRIWPAPTIERSARIAIAGPLTNAAVALIAMVLALQGVPFARYAALINAYLAVFNLLPFPGFDGQAVWAHSKAWSIGAIALSGGLLLASYVL